MRRFWISAGVFATLVNLWSAFNAASGVLISQLIVAFAFLALSLIAAFCTWVFLKDPLNIWPEGQQRGRQ